MYETNYKGQILLTGVVEEFIPEDKNGKARVLLYRVCVNKTDFRDHVWLTVVRQISYLSKGDKIQAFAKMKAYKRKDTTQGYGFSGIRCVEANSPRFVDYYKGN